MYDFARVPTTTYAIAMHMHRFGFAYSLFECIFATCVCTGAIARQSKQSFDYNYSLHRAWHDHMLSGIASFQIYQVKIR